MVENRANRIPFRFDMITREQAVGCAIEIFPETILSMNMPAERRVRLTHKIHNGIRRYIRFLTDDQRTIDDLEINLGSSNTFDPLSTTNLADTEKEDLDLLTDVFRDQPLGWGKNFELGETTVFLQKSKLPGMSLVNEINQQSGLVTVTLVGKNKLPLGVTP